MTFARMIDPEAEREIRFLLGRHVHLLDAGEAVAWAGLFTPDGRWIRRNVAPAALGGSGIAAGERRGRVELAELAASPVRNLRGPCPHQMTDILDDPRRHGGVATDVPPMGSGRPVSISED
ncbi:nuclear transport factor 2 family protein [Paracoccus binzhouensis]|uniref:nuclear transport factor 2 family protein n=1 Tax=Paracoccus binzhouensis TaxID=2796149 RepID=UPI0018EED559|nr:nuclear transport factor 2 family protein [Paracoccus binzhouensis]